MSLFVRQSRVTFHSPFITRIATLWPSVVYAAIKQITKPLAALEEMNPISLLSCRIANEHPKSRHKFLILFYSIGR